MAPECLSELFVPFIDSDHKYISYGLLPATNSSCPRSNCPLAGITFSAFLIQLFGIVSRNISQRNTWPSISWCSQTSF